MFNYIWPVAVVIAANTIYNICAKSMPSDLNSFASLTVTYLVAAAASAVLFFVTSGTRDIAAEIAKINWVPFAFGGAIVALEFGYINIYRAGWKVSTASLTANICLACVLLIVGLLFYKESVTPRQVAGMALCAAGLVLLGK